MISSSHLSGFFSLLEMFPSILPHLFLNTLPLFFMRASHAVLEVNNPSANTGETWVLSLDQEDTLGKGMATRSSILAWRIPRTEESGGLQSMGCKESE